MFAKIGCELDDPMGPRALVEDALPDSGLIRTGACTPDGGDLAFFFEAANEASLDSALTSGALEVGATDVQYRDGAVLLLARDTATANLFEEQFEGVG